MLSRRLVRWRVNARLSKTILATLPLDISTFLIVQSSFAFLLDPSEFPAALFIAKHYEFGNVFIFGMLSSRDIRSAEHLKSTHVDFS